MVCLRSKNSRVTSRGIRLRMWYAHGVVQLSVLLTLAVWLTKRPPLPENRSQVSN